MNEGRGSQGLRLLMQVERTEAAEWRRHTESPSAATRAKLFERYRNFALRLSCDEWKRIANLGLDRLDADQIAFEALLVAIDRFNPTKGVPFTAFVAKRIRGAIRNGLPRATEANALYNARKRTERDRFRSLEQAARLDASGPLELLRELAVGIAIGFLIQENSTAHLEAVPDADPSAYDAISWQQLVFELGARIDDLPERERLILEYHYKLDIQFAEIARLLDVSKGRVSQLHGQALKRLRTSLSKYR